MNVKVTLIFLTVCKAELQLVLDRSAQGLPSAVLKEGDPDVLAASLASELCGGTGTVQRHGFLAPGEGSGQSLTLLYTKLLPEDFIQDDLLDTATLIPVGLASEELSTSEARIMRQVVGELKADLDQVMQSRLNKRGLIHLLGLLPEIFDHKELAAAYYALTGEKPSSPLMLARMMLDSYTMGSGDKQREVKGRDLIREYEGGEPELLGQKWDKNKDLYRTGGPKAKRLYKKNLPD